MDVIGGKLYVNHLVKGLKGCDKTYFLVKKFCASYF